MTQQAVYYCYSSWRKRGGTHIDYCTEYNINVMGGLGEMMKISDAFFAHDFKMLADDAAEKTRKNHRIALFGRNGLTSVIGDILVTDVTQEHIMLWKIHMQNEGLKSSYRNTNLRQLRKLYKWLREDQGLNVLEDRSIKSLKEEQGKPRVTLTHEEVTRMIECATNPRDKAIIALLFGTGVRSDELIKLDRWDWQNAVNIREGLWEIWVLGKNRKHRPVEFFDEVKFYVDEYINSRTDCFRPLFISQQNRRVHPDTVGKMLHKVSGRAGVSKNVTQHVFRHSLATDLGSRGMPLPVLASILGHKDSTVTQKVYTHINVRHNRDAYAEYMPKALTISG